MQAIEATWTTTDVADYLKMSPETVRQWRRQGSGPSFARVGRYVRYEPQTVRDWFQDQATARSA